MFCEGVGAPEGEERIFGCNCFFYGKELPKLARTIQEPETAMKTITTFETRMIPNIFYCQDVYAILEISYPTGI
jgi:hypothetical protein